MIFCDIKQLPAPLQGLWHQDQARLWSMCGAYLQSGQAQWELWPPSLELSSILVRATTSCVGRPLHSRVASNQRSYAAIPKRTNRPG